jgi:3',5'-cyclic AMP phosphodiesterase CpdA
VLIVHGSDFQTGKPYRAHVAEAFIALTRESSPDLVVISGDLTQRARVVEFRTVRALIDRLDAPLVLTPGNHDVPLYRVWERGLMPYWNWRRFISRELDTVTRLEGRATVVALNSAAPRRALVGGYLGANQVAFARRAFSDAPADDLRVLVTHHHFVPAPSGEGGRPLPGAPGLLAAFEDMGVDFVLGGHVHQTHLTTSRRLLPDPSGRPGIPLLACGTTTSSRGRVREAGKNSLNVVRVEDRELVVTHHLYDVAAEKFVPAEERTFPRWRVAVGGT